MEDNNNNNNFAVYTSFNQWYKENYAAYGDYDGIKSCYFCGKFLQIDPMATNYKWYNVCSEYCGSQYKNGYFQDARNKYFNN